MKRSESNPAAGLTSKFRPDAYGPEGERPWYKRPAGFDPASCSARPLALRLMRAALQAHREAARLYREAQQRARAFEAKHPDAPKAELDEWVRWEEAAMGWLELTEEHFVTLMFLNAGRIDRYEDFQRRDEIMGDDWKPLAMELDGPHIVLTPQGSGISYPHVHVIDSSEFDSSEFGTRDRWEE